MITEEHVPDEEDDSSLVPTQEFNDLVILNEIIWRVLPLLTGTVWEGHNLCLLILGK